MDDIEKKFTRP